MKYAGLVSCMLLLAMLFASTLSFCSLVPSQHSYFASVAALSGILIYLSALALRSLFIPLDVLILC